MDSVDVSGGRGRCVTTFEERGGGGLMSTEVTVLDAGRILGKARPRAPLQPITTAEILEADILGVRDEWESGEGRWGKLG